MVQDDVAYREDDIGTLLEKTANFGFQEPTGEGEQESLKSGSTFGPGLEGVVVRVWDQDKALEVPAEDEGRVMFRKEGILSEGLTVEGRQSLGYYFSRSYRKFAWQGGSRLNDTKRGIFLASMVSC